MLSVSKLVTFVLIGTGAARSIQIPKPKISFPSDVGCGDVNVFYTGLAAYHPLVISQGSDPVEIDIALRNNTANLVKAGFNIYALFQGPDQPVSNLGDRMKGKHWGVTGVGWGIRNSTTPELVTWFEEILIEYRETEPLAPTVFNWGASTLAQSVTRHVPLNEDCTNKPGTLYGYEEICPPELCEKATVVKSGSLGELLRGIE
ncbi:hypothetical protein NM208_g3815 [Fusarium decemcellulare]|uniref:Uncharacterized protein n=1 Tax=Fusarium decemcellulare TaxID=57161 RepID=A0ACC1SN02_9HYPO|nr:hypothetical protein NM208_g3815 [Fusarium decemcellulare]